MYLKALQRPRQVPMRCSNEGLLRHGDKFGGLAPREPDHFPIFVRAPWLSPGSPLVAALPLLPEPPSPSFYPPVSYLPPHFSIAPLRFPPIDPPLCVSADERVGIPPPPSRSGLSSSLFACLLASMLSVCTSWPCYPPYCSPVARVFFAVLEPLDFCRVRL